VEKCDKAENSAQPMVEGRGWQAGAGSSSGDQLALTRPPRAARPVCCAAVAVRSQRPAATQAGDRNFGSNIDSRKFQKFRPRPSLSTLAW
jgi:hypothetical protein